MKKQHLFLIVFILNTLFVFSQNIPLTFEYNNQKYNIYNAVKVGEYLWMDNNLRTPLGDMPNTKEQIDALHRRYVMFENHQPPGQENRKDPTYWSYFNSEQQAMDEFNKYYGEYYRIRPAIVTGVDKNVKMYENNILKTGWGLPTVSDALQLLGMCGTANNMVEVKSYLTFDKDDPKAPTFAKIDAWRYSYYWCFRHNNNKYRLNLLPAGCRYENDDIMKTENYDKPKEFRVKRGDYNGLNQAYRLITTYGDLILGDYPEIEYSLMMQSFTVRFCRPLTDQELGYKIFISIEGNVNNISFPSKKLERYDWTGEPLYRSSEEQLIDYLRRGKIKIPDIKIKKINNPNAIAPSGYVELPKGLIRGLYVQHIIENKNKSVSDILNMILEIPALSKLWVLRNVGFLQIKATDVERDVEGKEIFLSGARYELKSKDGNIIYIDGNRIKEIPDDFYTITEINPPFGYNSIKEIKNITIKQGESLELPYEYFKKEKDKELLFTYNNVSKKYQGVKVGEYIWMNANLHNDYSNSIELSTTKEQIQKWYS